MSKDHIWIQDFDDNFGLSLKVEAEPLFSKQSNYQKVEVYQSIEFGKVLLLDGVVMYCEKDEAAYHEMLVHIPVFSKLGILDNVLIIGGGDGGSAREILKHESIKSVDLVELDALVIEAAQVFISKQKETFFDPRLNIYITDGFEFLEKATRNYYDLIIIDASDPVGAAEILFSKEMYERICSCLKQGGMMVTQAGSPYYKSDYLQNSWNHLKAIYGVDQVKCFMSTIPSYTMSLWSFLLAAKKSSSTREKPVESDAKIVDFVHKNRMEYYTKEIHRAAFALPQFLRDRLK